MASIDQVQLIDILRSNPNLKAVATPEPGSFREGFSRKFAEALKEFDRLSAAPNDPKTPYATKYARTFLVVLPFLSDPRDLSPPAGCGYCRHARQVPHQSVPLSLSVSVRLHAFMPADGAWQVPGAPDL